MSNFQFNPSPQQNPSINQNQHFSEGLPHKGLCTTKFTENFNQYHLPESFILGNNDLIDKNTETGFDSDDNDSQISFESRLEFNHSKNMLYALNKYFSQNQLAKQNVLIDERIHLKSRDIIKEIQEKILQDIQKKYGVQEEAKIKLMMKFIKNNDSTAKIYYDVVKRFTPQYRVSCYLFLRETVLTYLTARQEFRKLPKSFKQGEIESYFRQNLSKISQRIKQDEKLGVFKFNSDDQILNNKFEDFIFTWMINFFLSKEGFPSYEMEKDSRDREWYLGTYNDGEKRKKIKK